MRVIAEAIDAADFDHGPGGSEGIAIVAIPGGWDRKGFSDENFSSAGLEMI